MSNHVKFQDALLQEMILKNCLNRRIVDLNEEFNEDSIYKLIYMIEKIVSLDESKNIEMKDREPITIRINSYGGYCYELWSAIGVIESLKDKGYIINTVCMGKSMSCGFILFCAGVNRYMSKYSSLMYHNVSTGCYGKIPDIEDDLKEGKRLNTMADNYICDKTGMPLSKLKSVRRKDWFLTVEEAIKYNIATEII